jgi:dihydrolipoamide dehydrogenase
MKKKCDVAILGAGPGGYPAAIKASQGGKKVIIVEEALLGGTCLNWGCIPTKALLSTTGLYRHMLHAKELSIFATDVKVDWDGAITRKNAVVEKLRVGLRQVIESNGITIVHGRGRCASPNTLDVTGSDACTVEAENIVLATGSRPKDIPAVPFDGVHIHNSTSILSLRTIPESIAILGAGVIGCEFANLFEALGSKVTLVEAMQRILPFDCPIATESVAQAFRSRGVKLVTGQKVIDSKIDLEGVTLVCEDGTLIEAQMVLVAIGRALNTQDMGLEEIGLRTNRGAIVVNDQMQTNLESIYAVGDCTNKSLTAYVATHQGLVAAENILGNRAHMYYDAIPGVVFTYPEYASVGLSLEEAKKRNLQAILGSFPFQALGRAVASDGFNGFSQVVLEKDTGRILGAQVVGDRAGELIAEMSLAMANELTGECITHAIHAHPTYSECWPEAILIAQKRPLNFPKTSLPAVIKEP